jgi:hypothetical protein
MDPEARELLVDYYRDDVRRLERVLGRPLPWRNFAEASLEQEASAAREAV